MPKIKFETLIKKLFKTECLSEYRFHPERRWRFDYALPEHKIAVEVEGGIWRVGRHNSPTGFINDMEKYNSATSLGWKLLRVQPKDLLGTELIDFIKETIKNND
jgi:very-short-patch-repair endonuclease